MSFGVRRGLPASADPLPTAQGALTALCPGGLPFGARSAPALDPAASAPRWSWPHCSPRCAPSAGDRQGPVGTRGSRRACPHIPVSPAPTWSRVAGQGLWRRCLTMEMCRPRLRCTLQHSSQMSTPRLMDAQPGSGGGMGLSAGVPSPCRPLPVHPSSRGDVLPQQPFPGRWRGAQPITRGNPRVSHSNHQPKGGQGLAPHHEEDSWWPG